MDVDHFISTITAANCNSILAMKVKWWGKWENALLAIIPCRRQFSSSRNARCGSKEVKGNCVAKLMMSREVDVKVWRLEWMTKFDCFLVILFFSPHIQAQHRCLMLSRVKNCFISFLGAALRSLFALSICQTFVHSDDNGWNWSLQC